MLRLLAAVVGGITYIVRRLDKPKIRVSGYLCLESAEKLQLAHFKVMLRLPLKFSGSYFVFLFLFDS